MDYDSVYADAWSDVLEEEKNARRHDDGDGGGGGADGLHSKVGLLKRCDEFLSFLHGRKEEVVVVATHSLWLQAFVGVTLNVEKVEDRVPFFGTAELRSFDVKFGE